LSVLTAIKKGLEKPEKGAATATATLRDYLIVTWAVPEEQLRPLVLEALPLDRLPGPDGTLYGFVQLTCALHEATRWSPLPEALGDSYHRADVRILVRPESGDPGVFVRASYISAAGVVGALFPVAKGADEGRFKFHVAGNPAGEAFTSYTVRISTDGVQAELSVRATDTPPATPFGPWETLTPYLTQRLPHFWAARVGAGLTLIPTHHEPLTPLPGILERATLKALAGIELGEAVAVHYQSALPVTGYPPRAWK
jgi:hypothetical protein